MRLPRVLVTRPVAQATSLAARLREIGLEPVIVPTISIEPPLSFAGLDDALLHLERYRWIVFTSANGVDAFFQRRIALGSAGSAPAELRWAAIGPGTTDALTRHGVHKVWTPSRYLSEAVGDELPALPGERVLRVRAEVASASPADRLRVRGATVDEVVAYRTVEAPPGTARRLAEAWGQGLDGVIFTSASTVRGFARAVQEAELGHDVHTLRLIAIGPVTADAIAAAGWRVDLIAGEHTMEGIVRVLGERSHARAKGLSGA